MKILILTRFYHNGQSTHVFSLCKELLRQGHSPFLVISNLHDYQYLHWLRCNRIPFSSKLDANFLEQLIQKEKFQVIHTHSVHTLQIALALGKNHKLPVIATCHYLDFQPLQELKKVTKIIAISEEMKNKLKLPAHKTIVIENAVDTNTIKAYPKTTANLTAIILARATPTRARTFPIIGQALKDYGWRIMSLGDWQPQDPSITWVGWQTNVAPYLAKADLVIGTGRAIREGMVAGCIGCVLGEYYDGLVTPHTVEPLRKTNFSGRTFKYDLPNPVLKYFLDILSDIKKIRDLQQFSRLYGKNNFSLTTMVKTTIAVYRSCLK